MDLRNIQTYIRLAENGSFSKTAQELNYAQSTVTMQIQQLEKELGYRLFDRIGRTVSLTSMGQEFLGYAYEILRTMDRAMTLDKDPTYLHGTLRLGVLESLLFGTMLEIIPQFRSQYPNVCLQITMGQTTELVKQLKENKLDLVYLSGAENTDPDLKCCYQRQEELVFLCAPDHEAGRSTTMEEIFQYDFVLTERSGIWRPLVAAPSIHIWKSTAPLPFPMRSETDWVLRFYPSTACKASSMTERCCRSSHSSRGSIITVRSYATKNAGCLPLWKA